MEPSNVKPFRHQFLPLGNSAPGLCQKWCQQGVKNPPGNSSHPHMGSGSLLVRKVLVHTRNAFLNSPQFCAVQFSFV